MVTFYGSDILKKIILFLMILSIVGLGQNVLAEPEENDFGIVNAWYNGQESTVRDVQLKIGEPAEIKVEVSSKIDGHVNVKLVNPLKTESYEVVSGPSLIDKSIDNLFIKSGWNETYIWIIIPTAHHCTLNRYFAVPSPLSGRPNPVSHHDCCPRVGSRPAP